MKLSNQLGYVLPQIYHSDRPLTYPLPWVPKFGWLTGSGDWTNKVLLSLYDVIPMTNIGTNFAGNVIMRFSSNLGTVTNPACDCLWEYDATAFVLAIESGVITGAAGACVTFGMTSLTAHVLWYAQWCGASMGI